jgi:dTDP-4-dehydrorhamnose 3,5-epimerase
MEVPMIIRSTTLQDAVLIDLDKREDERGFFARAWCRREFDEHRLAPDMVQANISYNVAKGTLRGMHYQVEPYGEVKMVRCIRGRLYDVIIDLRPSSLTYRRWFGVELSAENRLMLYVPVGFAHGFQTLEDDTEAFYMVSQYYTPGAERGLRYNDPGFSISWPMTVSTISDKDSSWPEYRAPEAVAMMEGRS